MQKHIQFNIAYLIFAFFAVLFLQQWWHQVQTVEVVPYSQFEKLLQESKISLTRRFLLALEIRSTLAMEPGMDRET